MPPAGWLSDPNLTIGQDYHFLCVLYVSVLRRIPSCEQLYAPIRNYASSYPSLFATTFEVLLRVFPDAGLQH